MVRKKPEYQREPRELRDLILGQGFATPFQLARIIAWKSAIAVAGVTLNSEADIYRWTHEALLVRAETLDLDVMNPPDGFTWSDWETATRSIVGINTHQAAKQGCEPSGLLAIRGVDYPVASAFLCIVNSKCWPVMDRYALQTVFGSGSPATHFRAAHYRVFAEHLTTEGHNHWPGEATIHDLDQRAMRVSDPDEPDDLPAGWNYAASP